MAKLLRRGRDVPWIVPPRQGLIQTRRNQVSWTSPQCPTSRKCESSRLRCSFKWARALNSPSPAPQRGVGIPIPLSRSLAQEETVRFSGLSRRLQIDRFYDLAQGGECASPLGGLMRGAPFRSAALRAYAPGTAPPRRDKRIQTRHNHFDHLRWRPELSRV